MVETFGVGVGVVVDRVSEVLNIDGAVIEAPPSFGAGVSTEFLLSIGKAEKGVKLLLDIDKVLDQGDIAVLDEQLNGPESAAGEPS